MPKPVLLLRLEGPLQSWGGRSRWDVRDTGTEPTKSGVMGLVGCALGYERGDARLEALDRELRFGVRVEAPGRVLEDYQTITDYLPTADGRYKHSGIAVGSSLSKLKADPENKPATVISPRFYLEDAAFLVVLEAREQGGEALLEAASLAVQSPRWTLFLGRKACVPTRPIFDDFLPDRYENLEEALRRHPWSWTASCNHSAKTADRKLLQRNYEFGQMLLCWSESQRGPYRRQDALRVNPFRQYGFIQLERFHVAREAVSG